MKEIKMPYSEYKRMETKFKSDMLKLDEREKAIAIREDKVKELLKTELVFLIKSDKFDAFANGHLDNELDLIDKALYTQELNASERKQFFTKAFRYELERLERILGKDGKSIDSETARYELNKNELNNPKLVLNNLRCALKNMTFWQRFNFLFTNKTSN